MYPRAFCFGLLVLAPLLIPHPALPVEGAEAAGIVPGMSIREAVDRLEDLGLRILYSTDVLRARMRVADAPTSTDPAQALAEILLPVGLSVRPGPNDSLLIVGVEETATPDASDVGGESRGEDAPADVQPPRAPRIEEIVVAASRYELGRDGTATHSVLSRADLEYFPDIGEDALRAVSRLPGMANNGLSARNNVRGGEIGETLVRLDGLKLYDPFHLKDYQSVFSTLDPRAVDSMNVYTGGFPAVFGGRMSSVIDVVSMSPPEDRYHEIGLSFFNSSVLSSGRFDETRGEWLVSARRSNLDLLYDAFSDLPERPQYRDAFAKLSYELNENLKFSANALYSHDDISLAEDIDREEQAHSDHSDAYYWIRLDFVPASRWAGSTLVARSELVSRRMGTSAKSGISNGRLSERKSFAIESVKSDWSGALADSMLLQLGASFDRVHGSYAYDDDVEFDLLFDYPGTPSVPQRARSMRTMPTGRQFDAYASIKFSPSQRIAADVGIRWDRQDFDSLSSTTLSPRIGLRWQIAPRTDLRASWGRFSQPQRIDELQTSDGVVRFFPPQRSDHAVLGLEHSFTNGLRMRVETYDKSMRQLRPRFENLLNSRILLPELKPDRVRIAPDSARARGLELIVSQEADHGLSWWAAYSYSWVKDRFADSRVFRSWDQTHSLSAGMNWEGPKWNFSVDLLHRTGWPVSTIALADTDGDTPIAIVTGRNVDRFDSFQSLDVQLTRNIPLRRSDLSVTFELTNVLDRSNACCLEYEIGDEENEAGQLLTKTLHFLPRVPSVGILWKF